MGLSSEINNPSSDKNDSPKDQARLFGSIKYNDTEGSLRLDEPTKKADRSFFSEQHRSSSVFKPYKPNESSSINSIEHEILIKSSKKTTNEREEFSMNGNDEMTLDKKNNLENGNDNEEDEYEPEVDSLLIPIPKLPLKLNSTKRSTSNFDTSFSYFIEDQDVSSTIKSQTKEELRKEIDNLKILLSTTRRLNRLNLNVPIPLDDKSYRSEQDVHLQEENKELKMEINELKDILADNKLMFDNLNERYETHLQDTLELKNDLIETRALKDQLIDKFEYANAQAEKEHKITNDAINMLLSKLSSTLNYDPDMSINQSLDLKFETLSKWLDVLKTKSKEALDTKQANTILKLEKINQSFKKKWEDLKSEGLELRDLTIKQSENQEKLETKFIDLKSICDQLQKENQTLKEEVKIRDETIGNEKAEDYLKATLELTKTKLDDANKQNKELENEIIRLKHTQESSDDYQKIKSMNNNLIQENKALISKLKNIKMEQSKEVKENQQLSSNIDALMNDKTELSKTIAKLRKSEANISERVIELMKTQEQMRNKNDRLEQEIIDLIELFIRFANAQSVTFAQVLEDSSIAHLQRKLSKLNSSKRNLQDINLKSMINAIFDFFSETSKSVVEGYFEDIDKLADQERSSSDTIHAYERKIDQLTEELRWHIKNQHHQPQLQNINSTIRPHSPGSKLRIEALERKWKAEREKRKIEGDTANIAMKELQDKIEMLNKKLFRYTHPEKFAK